MCQYQCFSLDERYHKLGIRRMDAGLAFVRDIPPPIVMAQEGWGSVHVLRWNLVSFLTLSY